VRILGLAFLCLATLPAAFACSEAPAAGEDVDAAESDLVQFDASQFTGASAISYGNTSGAIATSSTKWGVVRWNGASGDDVVATVTATSADRVPRAYLVEKRADGKYVSVLSGTQSIDGIVRAKLDKTQSYFIVFRDRSRRAASFTVKLEHGAALPAGCTGTPLLGPGIIARTPQATTPYLYVTGVYESNIRRCNVATGCTDPVKQRNENAAFELTRGSDGKWTGGTPIQLTHDGTTGALQGSASVYADDGRSTTVAMTGAATTGCISMSGRTRSAIDALTYYDVDVSFLATTPPVAPRTAYPAKPPATECEGQTPIPDEEVLARFTPGNAELTLGVGQLMEDTQFCNPETGCEPWKRAPSPGNVWVYATALVTGHDALAIRFDHANSAVTTFPLDDGTLALGGEPVLRPGSTIKNAATISDTDLDIKETTVFSTTDGSGGTFKARRYACVPIVAHP
jgi:hypothetical protein